MRIPVLLSVLAFLPASAIAAEWANFEPAFPITACMDGWVACRIDDQEITPEPLPDSQGLLEPSDLRVSWFDLKPTPVFNPWKLLPDYPLTKAPEPEPEVAEVPEEEAEVPEGDTEVPEAVPASAPEVAAVPEERHEETREPVAVTEHPVAPEPVAHEETPPPQEEVSSMVRPQPVEPATPPPVEVAAETKPPEETVETPAPPPEEPKAPEEEAVASLTVEPTEVTCDNLQPLELKAMMGRLSPDEKGCVEALYQAAAKQTDKNKASRVLIANAHSSDRKEWARLVARHLEEVDQSDPDMSYSYAMYLLDRGPGSASEAIHWADIALERRDQWVGEIYKSRVYTLYKIRALAAEKLWKAAEERHASSPTDQSAKAAEDARGLVKTYSREWYDYGKAAGKDTTRPMDLCISAAGTEAYCSGG